MVTLPATSISLDELEKAWETYLEAGTSPPEVPVPGNYYGYGEPGYGDYCNAEAAAIAVTMRPADELTQEDKEAVVRYFRECADYLQALAYSLRQTCRNLEGQLTL